MTISDATFDLMRECWAASIPKPYRLTKQEHSSSNYTIGAIIAPPPKQAELLMFFLLLSPLHLTANQRRAKEARAKQVSGAGVRVRKSRAKPKPSLPPLSVGDLEAEGLELPFF